MVLPIENLLELMGRELNSKHHIYIWMELEKLASTMVFLERVLIYVIPPFLIFG